MGDAGSPGIPIEGFRRVRDPWDKLFVRDGQRSGGSERPEGPRRPSAKRPEPNIWNNFQVNDTGLLDVAGSPGFSNISFLRKPSFPPSEEGQGKESYATLFVLSQPETTRGDAVKGEIRKEERSQNLGTTAHCVKGSVRARRSKERKSMSAGGIWCKREGASAALEREGVSARERRS